MATLVLAGAVLAGVAVDAYRPALLFPDSFRYMAEADSFYFSRRAPAATACCCGRWPG